VIDYSYPQPEKRKHNADYHVCVFVLGKQQIYAKECNQVKNNLKRKYRLIVGVKNI
jgi:hypothetical protein